MLQLAQRAQLILERDSGIDAVQLVQLDALELEAAQAALTGGAQVLRPAVRRPPVGTGPLEPAFGGDHQLRRIRVEGLRDETLAHRRTVGIGRIDQGDAELERPPEHGDRLGVVARLAPDALTGEPHGAEAEPVDAALAAQEKAAAVRDRKVDRLCHAGPKPVCAVKHTGTCVTTAPGNRS